MGDSYIRSLMSTGETVQRVSRQHWVSLLSTVLVNGLALLLLLALSSWAFASSAAGVEGQALRWLGVLALVAMIYPAVRMARDLLRWQARRYVISSRRVLEIEGVFNRTVRDSNLDKVNDLVLRQTLMGRLLDYGDVDIITGSDVGLNRLERLAGPILFKKAILDNKEDFDALVRGGLPLSAQDGAPAGGADPATALAQLQDLREKQLISQDEFERKRAEVLARM